MNRRTFVIVLGLALTACAPRSRAQGVRWRDLGTLVVARQTERDEVRVADWRDNMRAIRLDIDRGTVDFKDIRVQYGNGQVHSVGRRITVRRGRAIVIDLPGAVRDVEKVIFFYESVGIERAVVHVSGR